MDGRSEFISVSIARDAGSVYAYAADPRHLPEWAPGLGSSIEPDGDQWVVHTAGGDLGLRFAAVNELGVLDHWVTQPDGVTVGYVPLRVLADGACCEVVFTLRRAEGMSDAELARDASAVRADLERLRSILETGAP